MLNDSSYHFLQRRQSPRSSRSRSRGREGSEHSDAKRSRRQSEKPKADERSEEEREVELKMARIREILRHRNDKKAIEEMRKRFFERLEAGLVVPPTPD